MQVHLEGVNKLFRGSTIVVSITDATRGELGDIVDAAKRLPEVRIPKDRLDMGSGSLTLEIPHSRMGRWAVTGLIDPRYISLNENEYHGTIPDELKRKLLPCYAEFVAEYDQRVIKIGDNYEISF